MKWPNYLLSFLITGALINTAICAQSAEQRNLQLSEAEQVWISQHPSVRIAFDGYFPPYSFIDEFDQLDGLAVDMVRLLSERTGINFEIDQRRQWADLYSAAQSHEIDVVATMVKRPERGQWFVFTRPYIFKSLIIMNRANDDSIVKREDIAGKSIALVKGYSYVPGVLAEFPSITPYYFDTMLDCLNAVATEQVDAAISFIGASQHLRNKYLLSNLKFAAVYDRDSSNESLAVRKDWPILIGILDKALDSISEVQKQILRKKWVPELTARTNWNTIIRLSLLFLLIAGSLLFWLYTMRKQKKQLKRARDEAVLANTELQRFQEQLETKVELRTAELAQSNHEVQKHRDHLEAEVEQRTKELNVRSQESDNLNKAMLAMLEDLHIINQRYENTAQALKSANEHLQQLDQLKSMFIASMSHELRTPLNPILGFTDLILQGHSGDITALQHDQLQRVHNAGKHLLLLITDIIDISKVEAGKAVVKLSDFDLAEMLHEAVQSQMLSAETKGLGLLLEPPAQEIVMHTDRARLLQCLLNLVSNAIKYSIQGQIRVTAWAQDEVVTIEVQDCGIGISLSEQQKLFQPFVRLDTELTVKAGGTGLGLHLVRKIITEILAGTVSVDSEAGVGSRFRLQLPQWLADAVPVSEQK